MPIVIDAGQDQPVRARWTDQDAVLLTAASVVTCTRTIYTRDDADALTVSTAAATLPDDAFFAEVEDADVFPFYDSAGNLIGYNFQDLVLGSTLSARGTRYVVRYVATDSSGRITVHEVEFHTRA